MTYIPTILFIVWFAAAKYSLSVNLAPGVPLPRANQLHRILMTRVFNRPHEADGSMLMNFLMGKFNPKDPAIPDIDVLDYTSFKKLLKVARERHMNNTVQKYEKEFYKLNKHILNNTRRNLNNTRRQSAQADSRVYDLGNLPGNSWWTLLFAGKYSDLWDRVSTYLWKYKKLDWPPENQTQFTDQEGRQHIPYFLNLMLQSIYTTRYNLKRTKPVRKMLSGDFNFKIGLMAGAIDEKRNKLDSLVSVMKQFKYIDEKGRPPATKFIYFLTVYEKILALNTEITLMVRRMFDMESEFKNFFSPLQNNYTKKNFKNTIYKDAENI